ncbi:hypothetical protein [Microvirga arabica]|uniref:hypothetical protein n=1 Tax=Microvirga arabica TaxID=1128671 RepID=UPI001939F19E|nr:hypothetical protein [Microvirga arabica]MBM1173880.1 hypothetical protein [Microvirga arabica]
MNTSNVFDPLRCTVRSPGGKHDPTSLVDPELIARKLIQAYARLGHTEPRPGCGGTETIAHCGAFDVHLSRSASDDQLAQEPPFWIEIRAHASKSVVECYGCYDFQDDELARILEFIGLVQRQYSIKG